MVNDDDKDISRVVTLGANGPSLRPSDRDAGIRSPQTSSTAPTPQQYAYAAFSPDGTKVVTQGMPRARLWDVATRQPVGAAITQRWAGAGPVAFSPDGTKVATVSDNLAAGTWDCLVQLSDANTGRPLAPPIHPIDTVKALAFSPDGSLLATGDFSDGVQLWDTTAGVPVGPRLPQANLVLALAFSPDGTRLAVGTTNDRGRNNSQVRLWDLTTHQPIGAPMMHRDSGSTTVVAFSPDGGMLLSVSHDGLTWRWDARTTQPIGQPIRHPTGFLGAVFRADSRAVLTGTKDGTVRLWDLRTGSPLSPPVNRPSAATALALRSRWHRVRRRLCRRDDATVGPRHRTPDRTAADPPRPRPGRRIRSRRPYTAFGRQHRRHPDLDRATPGDRFDEPAPAASSGAYWDGARARPVRQVPRPGDLEGTARGGRGPLESGKLVRDDAEALGWHEARARTAEDSGMAFATLWHLDRLVAARPDEGTLLVRRPWCRLPLASSSRPRGS